MALSFLFMREKLGVPTRIPEQARLWRWPSRWVVLTASFSLTTLAVAAMVQAVSCCTTWVNSVRSRFMNSKASVDYERQRRTELAGTITPHVCFSMWNVRWQRSQGLGIMLTCPNSLTWISWRRQRGKRLLFSVRTEFQPRHSETMSQEWASFSHCCSPINDLESRVASRRTHTYSPNRLKTCFDVSPIWLKFLL